MFHRRRHLLRDTIVLTLPLALFLFYMIGSALVSFYNAEIVNFSGYPTRSLRVDGLNSMFRYASSPLFDPRSRRYLSEQDLLRPEVRVFDLRVDGNSLQDLDASMPASAKEWVRAWLMESGKRNRVDVRYRGQRMENFFWDQKSWKIKTGKRGLVDGYRTINLTQAFGRLDNHLTFMVGDELGIPTPKSRIVRLYLNLRDQGIYLQEEQIDESMIRRTGRMPGDVFYGEVFVPDEPKLSTDDLFCNPFLWRKKARFNKYSEEYRPHLTRLLDLISDERPESWNELYQLLDYDEFVRYMALIAFQGDQHVDHSHNHKLYFSPVSGKFEAIPWNVRLNMPRGHGVESMANRLFRKLARDPRFLDDVHRVVEEQLLDRNMTRKMVKELERIRHVYGQYAVDFTEFDYYLTQMSQIAHARKKTLEGFREHAELQWDCRSSGQVVELTLNARGLTSLSLEGLILAQECPGIRVYEDRDFNGKVSPADRELDVTISENVLRITNEDALVYVGRDFSAPYRSITEEDKESFQVHRAFTRFGYLQSPILLAAAGETDLPRVEQVQVTRAIGSGAVAVQRGVPLEEGSIDTQHPWTMLRSTPGTEYELAGEVELQEDLIIERRDSLKVAPDTTLKMGPGVSLVIQCQVELNGLKVQRLDPLRPWGVVALHGAGAAGSKLVNCDLDGGSHDTIRFVDYLGMFSAHEVDNVLLLNSTFSNNLLGDDTVRFARCHDLRVDGVKVLGANGDAIDCDLSTGDIVNTEIIEPHNDGIDLMTAIVNLDSVVVQGAGDKGVSLGENANPTIRRTTLTDCNIGIAMKDGSDPVIENCVIRGCKVGVAGYDKNWRYPGGGKGTLRQCRLVDNRVDVELDLASSLFLDHSPSGGVFSLPDGYDHEQFRILPLPETTP